MLLNRLSSSCRFQCKPKEGDEIISHKVPGSKYTVRVWNGGVAQYRGWRFDLFDVSTSTTVNLPRDFAFIDVRGVAGPARSKLLNLEEGMGIPRVEMQPGMENWTAPEGSKIIIGAYLDIIMYHHSVALCSVIAAIAGDNTLKLMDPA